VHKSYQEKTYLISHTIMTQLTHGSSNMWIQALTVRYSLFTLTQVLISIHLRLCRKPTSDSKEREIPLKMKSNWETLLQQSQT